ncbi:MAG TPA: ABC transporter ATP-binding protein [Deltaproteobacteria bacterium]|nr:ABC transporter ATP-binding protein [Deltaproteobacteria bacterium]
MKPAVEVEGLTKVFGGFRAVDGISFRLRRGEILGVLGPNGAGKTTTLQMLMGLTTPTSGSVRILGMDLEREREEILSRINFSSSYVSLPYSLTVRENLDVFARLYGVRRRREKIERLLRAFEIEEVGDVTTRKLSSGQITRACLAKALLNDPEVLFLDEPTASLDPDMADKTRSLLRRIKEERNFSIVYTSHNMQEMEEMSDRLMLLVKGRIAATGTPAAILDRFGCATLEEVFLKVTRGGRGSGAGAAPRGERA